jgi:hypothetical protein
VMKWAGLNEARLQAIARARGYKPGWVYYRLLTAREATSAQKAEGVGSGS